MNVADNPISKPYLGGIIALLGTYAMVQLEGNLIHAHGCVCRIAWVAMRAPAYIAKPIINIAYHFISKYGAL